MVTDYSLTTKVLTDCMESCDDFIEFNASLELEIPKKKKLYKIVKDCSEICMIANDYMTRESIYAKRMLKFCSEVCHKCADEFEKSDLRFEYRKYRDQCRICAEQCALVS